jgi:hypothetical protein
MSIRTALCIGAFAGVAGCSSPSSNSGSFTCAPIAGSYSVRFTTRSGNCGDIPEQVINFDSSMTRMQAAQCTGSSSISPNKCDVSYDTTCPVPQTGGSIREEGAGHMAPGGSTITGTEQITLFDASGNIVCSGTYDLMYQRL